MAFLTDSNKTAAAEQIKNWNNQVINSLDNLAANKQNLLVQLEAMKTNTDYTASDIAEVQNLISVINTRIATL